MPRVRCAHQAVNVCITETYWQIGYRIVEFEQSGKARADYGKALLANLSRDLTLRHGKGFSRSNLVYMRILYLNYPISQKPSDLLSWSHYVELHRIDDKLEHSFYEQQAISEKWSVPDLPELAGKIGLIVAGTLRVPYTQNEISRTFAAHGMCLLLTGHPSLDTGPRHV